MHRSLNVRAALMCAIVALSAAQPAPAAEENCVVASRACVEAGGTRWIDGVPVTRDCWSWRETYACLQPEDAALNGCATLSADAAVSGPGGCEMKEKTCSQKMTDADGNETCLVWKQTWACDAKIELPAVNAEWTHSTTEVEETIDETQCGALHERDECVRGEVKCTEKGCELVYYCGAKTASGCSALRAAGCTITREPECDADLDASCRLKAGEALCTGGVPEGVIEAQDAEITGETTVNVGSPAPDAAACTELSEKLSSDGMACTQISQTCVDKDPMIRVINGVTYRASCWGYERLYRCERVQPSSTCSGLQASPGCREVSRTCEQEGESGCEKERVVYDCGRVESVSPGEAELVESVDVITGLVEVDACAELDSSEVCRKTEEVCVEPGGTKIVDGVPVTKDCWARRLTYVCGSGAGEAAVDDGCRALEERSDCRLEDETCLGRDEAGACTMLSKTFVCGGGSQEVTAGRICDGELCLAGVCEPAQPETSEDFVEGMAILEILREAGVYGDVAGDRLFAGAESGCSVKLMGFSCCRSDVEGAAGTMSNSALSIGLSVGADAGFELVKWLGSPYVYDILSDFEATQGVLQALYGAAGSGVYSPSLSYYGVTVGANSAGSLTLEFSPAGFIAAVALEMAAEYFSCTDADRLHALRKSRGLCHYVGSYCDKTSGAGCLEKKESWVCFNSRIARTVQEQGRKQLGIGWGTPREPIARGFTLEEFEQLDFSKMDLSAVIAEVAQQAAQSGALSGKKPDVEAVSARARERVKAAADSDQYVAVDSVTGKCFVGEAGAGVSCTAVRALLAPYARASESGDSRVLRGRPRGSAL